MTKNLLFALFFSTTTLSFSEEIISLNQNWKFRQADSSEEWKAASVPGNVHTDLLAQGLIKNPFYRDEEKKLAWIEHADWEYQLEFELSKTFLSYDNILLQFEGLDTYADVYLNGEKLLTSDNMFVPKEQFPTNLKVGKNHLKIYFFSANRKAKEAKKTHIVSNLPTTDNDTSEIAMFARKAQYHYGWDWGPRFVTAGIWKPVQIKAWNECRIVDVQTIQHSLSEAKAEMSLKVEIDKGQKINASELVAKVFVDDREIKIEKVYPSALNNTFNIPFEISNPRKWWPVGYGEQYLYDIRVALYHKGKKIAQHSHKTGLRTIEVITSPDEVGTPMYFRVNGVNIFAKGANYIPQDSFTPRVTQKRYLHTLKSARDANMNMIRIWGGGIYEEDKFYEICDSLGILVWQDFMFACAMYPGNRAFMQSVKEEAIAQVKRIRNHACLALWCGNNEVELGWQNWWIVFKKTNMHAGKVWNDYKELFHHLLKEVVEVHDPKTTYWRSSPTSNNDDLNAKNEQHGDKHYWGVWAASAPIEKYRDHIGRFVSEYGFQAFPTLNTIKKFSIEEDWSMNSEIMKRHQKHRVGNPQIMKYMKSWYRQPKDFESFVYCSQLLQAEAIKIAIDAHRAKKPYCMGSLYWQLNDCWPVASWSSMDYYGEWKALQYFVKNAFAPMNVTSLTEKNKLKVFVNSDITEKTDGTLSVEWFTFSGKSLGREERSLQVKANEESAMVEFIIGNPILEMKKKVYCSIKFETTEGKTFTSKSFLVRPMHLDLPQTDLDFKIHTKGKKTIIEVTTSNFAKNIEVLLNNDINEEGDFVNYRLSDNYFDLASGESKNITIEGIDFNEELLKQSIQLRSLVNSY